MTIDRVELFNYLRNCPQLSDLWSIGATEEQGVRVILPQGSSDVYSYNESFDIYGDYHFDATPMPSVYEDFQINCFEFYSATDEASPSSNINVLSLNEVQQICDWIKDKNKKRELPELTDIKVVTIECFPFVPQIRFIDRDKNIIAYFITVRVRYINPDREGVSVEYD
jgi:hypothetical protein